MLEYIQRLAQKAGVDEFSIEKDTEAYEAVIEVLDGVRKDLYSDNSKFRDKPPNFVEEDSLFLIPEIMKSLSYVNFQNALHFALMVIPRHFMIISRLSKVIKENKSSWAGYIRQIIEYSQRRQSEPKTNRKKRWSCWC